MSHGRHRLFDAKRRNGWHTCMRGNVMHRVVTRQYGRKVYHIIRFPHWQQAMDYANARATEGNR